MAAEGVRWRNVRDFLDDLPVRHCSLKPQHEFCTICMRINYGVAHDCPLYAKRYEEPPESKAAPAPPPRPPAPRAPHKPMEHPHDAVTDRVTVDVVEHVLSGEDFPVIEFAGPRKAHTKKAPPTKGAARAFPKEEALEVMAIEVEPIKAPPARKAERRPEPQREPEQSPEAMHEEGTADDLTPEASPGPPTTTVARDEVTADPPEAEPEPVERPKVDPEELMHRIMEELEIPEEEEDEADEAPAPAPSEDAKGSGEQLKTRDDGGPPVVEKKIVLRRRKKGED